MLNYNKTTWVNTMNKVSTVGYKYFCIELADLVTSGTASVQIGCSTATGNTTSFTGKSRSYGADITDNAEETIKAENNILRLDISNNTELSNLGVRFATSSLTGNRTLKTKILRVWLEK